MERFTEKSEEGTIVLRDNNAATITCAMKKLYDYEEKEENGLLVHLIVKLGDTIYKIPSKTNYKINIINKLAELNRVYKQKVTGIKISESGLFIETCDGMGGVTPKNFGDCWFLKEDEAEQKLKEMESKSND